jgi:hypothetical protein
MGFEIDVAKTDVTIATVIMNRKIDQSLVSSAGNQAMNELWCQRAMTNLSFNVVDALEGEVHLADMQNRSTFGLRSTGKKDGPVLFVITGEKMTIEAIEVLARDADATVVIHCFSK